MKKHSPTRSGPLKHHEPETLRVGLASKSTATPVRLGLQSAVDRDDLGQAIQSLPSKAFECRKLLYQ